MNFYEGYKKRKGYQMKWKDKERAIRWMEIRGYQVVRLENTWWWFLAVRWEHACLVVVKRREWTSDEDHKRLEGLQSSKLEQVVLRWDDQAKQPRIARVFNRKVTELYTHPLLPPRKEGDLIGNHSL